MAITYNFLTSGSQFNTDPSTTASITPGSNRLVLAVVSTNNTMAAPTLSGNGLTWVQIASVVDGARRTTLFRAMGASPSTGSVSIDFPATPNEVLWAIVEFAGVDTSGTNGSGAVVQAVTGSSDATTSFTITLAAFGDAANATYGCVGTTVATITAGGGFTQIVNQGTNLKQHAQYKLANDTTVDWTSVDNENWRGIALEIKAAAAGAGAAVSATGPMYLRMQRTLHQSWTVPRGA